MCRKKRREIIPLARYGAPFVIFYSLTRELGYPILKIIIFIHADINTKLYLQYFFLKCTNLKLCTLYYIHTLYQKIALLQLYNFKSLNYNSPSPCKFKRTIN